MSVRIAPPYFLVFLMGLIGFALILLSMPAAIIWGVTAEILDHGPPFPPFGGTSYSSRVTWAIWLYIFSGVLATVPSTMLYFLIGFVFQGIADRRKARAILEKGGPKTLQEYLLFFPDACPKCGFREIRVEYFAEETPPVGAKFSYCKW